MDGKSVADQAVTTKNGAFAAPHKLAQGEFAIVSLVDQAIGCDGLIDELRLSRGLREIVVSEKPLTADDTTLGLWNFDELTGGGCFVDLSANKRKAWLPGSADGMPESAKKK